MVSAALTFDATDWETAQTVTVTGVSDGDTANENVTVSHIISGYTGVSADDIDDVTVKVTDAGGTATVGVRVLPVRLFLTEEGDKGKYEVILNTAPAATATVTPASNNPAVIVSPATLTFTSADYSTAQTVTVTANDDADTDDPEGITIRHGVTGYSGVSNGEKVTVDVTDNDEPMAAPVLTSASSPTNGVLSVTWTHAGSSAGDYVTNAASFDLWRVEHRLSGEGDNWQLQSDRSRRGSAGLNVRSWNAVNIGPEVYPDGASVEVRVQAVAKDSNEFRLLGAPSNIRTVTFKNSTKAALTLTGTPVTVAPGSTATYTVALTKRYAGTLSITSANTDKATVGSASLSFTISD